MAQKQEHGAKKRRRQFRELAGLAYRRELEEALGQLEASFKAWRSGEIGPFELSDRIHKFHNGPSRELWSTYESLDAEMSVPLAFVRGVLKEEDVPPELLEQLRRTAELHRLPDD